MKGETYFTSQRNAPCFPQTSTAGTRSPSCDASLGREYLRMTRAGDESAMMLREYPHDGREGGGGGTMNDAKCKRGLRVPSASITLVTTNVFSTKGGQVAARQRYHCSSVVRPFSRLRHRQRGRTGLRHPCLLNKACALAALHAHTHRRDVFVYPGFRPRSADPTFPSLVCLAGGRWRPLSGGVGQQSPPPSVLHQLC